MSTDPAAVNFSELVNKNKQTLARLQESPRLLLHRRDGEDLVLTTAGRGDRAAPPAPEGHWEVRFADAASAKGWESLAQQARENTYRAWITMRTNPTFAGTGHPRATDRR